ncbi:MAG TPA: ATP-binding protein [Tepidisphaeraceae bacterium]|jgi:signal transduction histidine kinase|nr:ATP-binding protein [Tepidisphaeraceae bacterium]
MTRRIAITMMLTVWATILVAGTTAWIAAWVILLRNLDRRVLDMAKAHLGVGLGARVVVNDSAGGPRIRERAHEDPDPPVTARQFVINPDGYFRKLEVVVPGSASPGVFELPADDFIFTMEALAGSLAACGIAAGAAAALVARRIARLSLRPLNQTAAVIGTIDEANLDQRIEAEELPVELRPMAGRLNEMLERLSRAFEQRRRFLADASHELRTPVAAIITTMEVALRRPRTASELTETLETCLSEARHMRLLVQALLRQVRAEGIVGDEEAESLDAGAMLKQCADLAGSLAAERNVSVVRRVQGLVPVHAQPGRLRSVVLNLMSNAIEYNHAGGTVELSARSDEASTEIIVKDDGPGISPEHLPHLFQPFYRATRSRESDGHLGLGLFLVDSHVKAMGGECRVESALGRGTTFRVRLPGNSRRTNGNGGV